MEYIELASVLAACNEFLLDPTDEDAIAGMNKIYESIIIKPHLPLSQRQNTLLRVLVDIRVNEEATLIDIANALELSLTFNGLLAYTNINPDVVDNYKNEIMYDLLWMSGFCDFVLDRCQKDFERLEKQVYSMISFDNLRLLIENLAQLDVGNIEQLTEEFKAFTFKANPETIKNLADISRFNDPFVQEFKTGMTNAMYKALGPKEDNTSEKNN
jgi:hypothetical protein